jgi:3'-5' exoribonuclease 1
VIYIILDIEATCWNTFAEKQHNFSEIIEIGAVKLDNDLNEISRFDTFVQPVIHTTLSPFCLELTTIRQDQVELAPKFTESLYAFYKWIVKGTENEPIHSYMLLSWGEYDRKQLEREIEKKIQDFDQHLGWKKEVFFEMLSTRHVSLKHAYIRAFNVHTGAGLKSTLSRLGLSFDGTHHRGIDDSVNIAKIFRSIREDLEM